MVGETFFSLMRKVIGLHPSSESHSIGELAHGFMVVGSN